MLVIVFVLPTLLQTLVQTTLNITVDASCAVFAVFVACSMLPCMAAFRLLLPGCAECLQCPSCSGPELMRRLQSLRRPAEVSSQPARTPARQAVPSREDEPLEQVS